MQVEEADEQGDVSHAIWAVFGACDVLLQQWLCFCWGGDLFSEFFHEKGGVGELVCLFIDSSSEDAEFECYEQNDAACDEEVVIDVFQLHLKIQNNKVRWWLVGEGAWRWLLY